MVKSIVDMEYTVCFYVTGDFLQSEPQTCLYPNKLLSSLPFALRTYALHRVLPPILSFLPLFWRMMQCLRIFADTRRYTGVWQWKHLGNSGKYLCGFGVIFFSALHENLYNISFVGAYSSHEMTPLTQLQTQRRDGAPHVSCGLSASSYPRCICLSGI